MLISPGTPDVIGRRAMSRLRIIASIATAGVALLVMSGCESQMFEGPLSLKSTGSGLEVGVCVAVEVAKVDGALRRPGFLYRPWETIWDETTDEHHEVAAGEVIGPGILDGSSADDVEVASIAPGDELDITLTSPDGTVVSAVFTVPESGVPETGWLAPDGSITRGVCDSWNDRTQENG